MRIRHMALLATMGLIIAACGDQQNTQSGTPDAVGNAMAQSSAPMLAAAIETETGGSGIIETPDGNVWYGDWNKAVAAAQEQKKPLYIHFTAAWCTWCKKMEAETYTNEEIKNRFKNWVLLKVDTEATDKSGKIYLNVEEKKLSLFPAGEGFQEESLPYPQLLRVFGGQGIPHLCFTDTDGILLFTNPGYLTTTQFGPMLDYFQEELYKNSVNLGEYIESHN